MKAWEIALDRLEDEISKWAIISEHCPHDLGILNEPDYCCNEKCAECWDREVPNGLPSEKLQSK